MINTGRFNQDADSVTRYIERDLSDSEMEIVDKVIDVLQGDNLKSQYTLKVIVDELFKNLTNYK